ncbi:unnamed protein product [Parnassius apollo]|uniref:Carboxypeptidase n=1 Tax=Parnassius apollo TaxID=110799 RepID=A0A8S3X249_PARAO|nr:unnamed protein product [Parnassius apollo]
MVLTKIIIFCVFSAIFTSVYCKVALSEQKIADILNSIGKTEAKDVIKNEDVTTIATVDHIIGGEKAVQEITNNSIEDDTKENKTKKDEASKSVNQTCKKTDSSEIEDSEEYNGKACANETENLTALILTPFIERGQLQEARNASRVDPQLFLGVESYSGYFTVNKTYNSNLFFWYFPVENKPVNKTPWIIWLQGGPGASSMTGLFDEIGPFTIDATFKLKRNQYSWLQNHSLVFFDNPVGTGFSFTEDNKGYTRDMTTYSSHLYTAFQQFLQVFPELRTAPLYVAGESYAGKYVPSLGVEIHKRMNKPGGDVNLQGFMIGNAYVDPAVILQIPRPFYHFGLLGMEQMDMVKPLVDALAQEIAANNSIVAKTKWLNLISLLLVLTHQSHAYNFLQNDLKLGKYVPYMNKPEIQKAIHVRNTKFGFVNMTVHAHLALDFLSSGKGHFETLLEHYRVLAYCGQLDLMMPCVTTSENYRTWKWNGTDKFIKAPRLPYMYRNKRAGYHKTGGGLTEVVFLGAGHMVPLDVPGPAKDLVTRWTHNKTLSISFPILEGTFIGDFIKNNSMLPYL